MALLIDEGIRLVERSTREGPYEMQQQHFHAKHELYFLEKGKAKYFLGSEIFILNPGDMIFVPKGTFHKTSYLEKESAERLLFVFDDSYIDEACQPFLENVKQKKLIRFAPDRLYKMQEVAHRLEKEALSKDTGAEQMMRLYFHQLLILISRYALQDNPIKLSGSYEIMQNAAKYISENCDADLSLQALSRKFAMSPSHFSRLFKSVTGIGLNEYINISRISAAEKLLTKKALPITEVALRCGFNDSNYFASIFKKIKGVTPKKFSIMHRET